MIYSVFSLSIYEEPFEIYLLTLYMSVVPWAASCPLLSVGIAGDGRYLKRDKSLLSDSYRL
jgi:hypothetical protein